MTARPSPRRRRARCSKACSATICTGAGRWRVAGDAIDPESLAMPLLNIVSTTDRIVPAATAVRAGERLDLALGHVGMVVGSRARAICSGSRWPAGFPALQQAARAPPTHESETRSP